MIQEPCFNSAKARAIIRKLGFTQSIISEARGFSGGVWILWNNDDIIISPLVIHDQFIHAKVVQSNESPWILIAIFGSLEVLIVTQVGRSWKICRFRMMFVGCSLVILMILPRWMSRMVRLRWI